MSYQRPRGIFEHEYQVKKSRFIARVIPVECRDEVNAAVHDARVAYPDARHHCWAYLLGKPEDAASAGMSDDGEPAGTAGKPILNVLQHGHLGDVLVVVIRYFGGIKLGAGGLVRAYSTATQMALEQAPAKMRRELQHFIARGNFKDEQALRHWLSAADGKLLEIEYGQEVQFRLAIPTGQAAGLADFCAAHHIALVDPAA